MKNILRLEEAGMFAAGIWIFYTQTDYAGWLFWALLLAPDIGMLGYLINTATGAFTYNLLHHKGLAILLIFLGSNYAMPAVMVGGVIIFAHASFDRIWGYGLKFSDSFHHTHLGMIGPENKR